MKKNTKNLGLGLTGKICAGLFALFLLSAVPTTPAFAAVSVYDATRLALIKQKWAEKKIDWLKTLSLLSKTIKGVTSVLEVVDEFMDLLNDALMTSGMLHLLEGEMLMKTKLAIAEAKDVEGVQNVLLRRALETRMEYVKPPTQHLCKSVLVQQLAMTTEEFEEAVACFASSAIEDMFRSSGDDGSGPQYAADQWKNRCKMKFGNPIDGYESDCVDNSTKGMDGRKLTDADLTASILDGGQILEVVKTSSKTEGGVAYEVMDPQNTEQKFWVAGLFYCINLAGPRPSPPVKEKILTPEGLVKRAQWNHCAAMQSAAIKACTNLLAYYSRPNSSNNTLRTAQEKLCTEAKNANAIPKDFDCASGLSAAKALEIGNALFSSEQYYVAAGLSGQSHADMMRMLARAAANRNAAAAMEAERRGALAEATAGLDKIQECWKNVER